MLDDDFPDAPSEDIDSLVDRIDDLVSDAVMEIYGDVCNQYRFDNNLD
jgi:hypothetical protein